MPFSSYSELIDEVVDLIGRRSIRNKAPGWIHMAEKEAVTKIREIREIIYKTTGTFTPAVDTITLPDGISELIGFQIDENPIRIVDNVGMVEFLKRRTLNTAAAEQWPTVYTLTGADTMEVAPAPKSAAGYTLYYKGNTPSVTDTKITSRMLEEAPHLLLYGAAVHSSVYIRHDERLALWQSLFQDAIQSYGTFLARGAQDTPQASRYAGGNDFPQTTGSF